MYPLRELQQDFRRALLEGGEAAFCAHLEADGLAPEERVAVYRNNVVASLTDTLKDVYPAVCRLVDARFFAYAAHEFLRAHPPAEPRLSQYGAAFAGFLESFPPCRHLDYLPDVARLEWLMNAAAHAPEAAPIDPAALSGVAESETPRLRLSLHPSLGYLASRFPVDAIWRANRRDESEEGAVDLNAGEVTLEVARHGGAVVMQRLESGTYAFRAALALGRNLERAAESALAADGNFDVTGEFADLFRDRIVTGFTLDSAEGGA